jgi:hypothetical protein
MKKQFFKIIFIIIITFILSGCEIEYDLEINDNRVAETTSIYTTDIENLEINRSSLGNISYKDYFDDLLNNSYNVYYDEVEPLDEGQQQDLSKEMYKLSNINTSSKYGIQAFYEFSIDNYYRSNAVKKCNDYLNVSFENNVISIKSGNNYTCFENQNDLDKIIVKITTDEKMVFNNADSVNGNTYMWEINKSNYLNKGILFYYNLENNTTTNDISSTTVENPNNSESNNRFELSEQQKNYTIIIMITFVVLLIIFVKIKRKRL